MTLVLALAPEVTASAGTGSTAATRLEGTRIVWSRYVDDEGSASQLLISAYAGGPVTELTQLPEGYADDNGQLSPDGTVVLFERYPTDGNGRSRFGLVNPDGTGLRMIDLGCRVPCASDVLPRWAPDGKHFYVTRITGPFAPPNGVAASSVLRRSNLDGTEITRVSEPGMDRAYEDIAAGVAPSLSGDAGSPPNLAETENRLDHVSPRTLPRGRKASS